jgi:hypothetical protein
MGAFILKGVDSMAVDYAKKVVDLKKQYETEKKMYKGTGTYDTSEAASLLRDRANAYRQLGQLDESQYGMNVTTAQANNNYTKAATNKTPTVEVPQYPTTIPTYTLPTYKTPDFSSQINNKYSSLISSNLANLKAAYDKSRSDVNAQIPGIQQDARAARTSNETDYMKSLPDLYRAMEAAGQKGGENITGNIALQTTRGQNLGGINQTEMNNLAALQKTIADLNAEQPLKEQSVQQQLKSEQEQALMDAQKYGLDYGLRMADLTGKVNVAPGVEMPTMEAQRMLSDDAYRNKAFDYGVSQDTLNRTDMLSQQNLDNLYRSQVFDYNKSRDTVSDSQWQQTMGLNLRQQTFSEAQQKIENALAQKRISQDDASQALQWAKFNAEQDPNSIDNQLKKQTIDINAQSKADSTLNNTIQRLDSLYTYKDSVTDQVKRNPNYSDAQLRAAIIGLNLLDEQTDALLLRYGLPIN